MYSLVPRPLKIQPGVRCSRMCTIFVKIIWFTLLDVHRFPCFYGNSVHAQTVYTRPIFFNWPRNEANICSATVALYIEVPISMVTD